MKYLLKLINVLLKYIPFVPITAQIVLLFYPYFILSLHKQLFDIHYHSSSSGKIGLPMGIMLFLSLSLGNAFLISNASSESSPE